MRGMGFTALLIVFVAFAGGCVQAVNVSGPFPAERVVSLDSPRPSAEEADLVVRARVERSYFTKDEEMPDELTLVVDGLKLFERVMGAPVAEPDEGKDDVFVYELKGRLRLLPGAHKVSMDLGGMGFMTVVVGLRGGRIHELVYEPIYGRHRHIRKRALRLLSRERVFPLELAGFKAYLDGTEVSTQG